MGSMEPSSVPGRLPLVVLTGRPNVGKSTLFNRILGQHRAVVEATPGVTRDRLYAEAEWAGHTFLIGDTGGIGGGDADPFAPLVWAQAEAALAAADVIVLVVDSRVGLTPGDREIATRIRRLARPVVLVANKSDRPGAAEAYEFYALGLGEPFAVSGARGEGLGDALDRVVALLPRRGGDGPAARTDGSGAGGAPEDEAAGIPVAIVGRPNVGKSSLINRLIGDERMIVSPLAGTTRDAVDVPWEAEGHRFILVDTPGMRRPARIDPRSLEQLVTRQSAAAIRRADVVVVLLDATEPATDQDKRIAGLAKDAGRAVVVASNKVDLLSGPAAATLQARVRTELPFLPHALYVDCSARTGHGLGDLPAAVAAAAGAFRRRLPTAALNQCLRAAVALQPPAALAGKPVRVYYAAQVGTEPPRVALFTNRRGGLTDAYVRYLENQVRRRFELDGTPIRWAFRVRQHRALHLGSAAATATGRRPGRPSRGR